MKGSGTGVEHRKAAGDEREWNIGRLLKMRERVKQEWNIGRLLEMRGSGTGVEHRKAAGDEMYT